MKRPFLGAALAALAGFGLTQVAEAGTIQVQSAGGAFGGGEFTVTQFTGGGYNTVGEGVTLSGGLFQTFCLETNESIVLNTTMDWSMSEGAVGGGYTGGPNDPIDAKTAYLFSKFWDGQLEGYEYTAGADRVASTQALQLAIWQIEGELQPGDLTTAYNASAEAQAWVAEATEAVANGTWTGINGVRVLNLTENGENRQSVLVIVPLPPAAMLGMGLMSAMGVVGLIRRRRQNQILA